MPPQSDESDVNSFGDLTMNGDSTVGRSSSPQRVANDTPTVAFSTAGVDSSTADPSFDDVKQVLQASINFEQVQFPLSEPMDAHRASSSSLYPPLDSVSNLVRDQSEDEVEKSWEAGSHHSQKKRSASLKRPCSQSNMDITLGTLPSGSLATPTVAAVDPVGYATLDGTATETSYTPVARASMPTNVGSEDTDMIAPKLDAYGDGHSTFPAAAIPPSTRSEDDDMVAMKMAAYYGGQPTSVGGTTVDHAMVVDMDLHPSEPCDNEVQAEFVCQDYGASASGLAAYATPTPHDIATPHPLVAAAGASTQVMEAGMIENRPLNGTVVEVWDTAETTEAVVLPDQQLVATANIVDLDIKPPAVDPPQTYEAHYDENDHVVPIHSYEVQADQQAQATVVDYDVHPAEISSHAIQAEYLGQELHSDAATRPLDSNTIQEAEASDVTDALNLTFNATDETGEAVTEATVIESGPMHKATEQAWSSGAAEEAQVLQETPIEAASEVNVKSLHVQDELHPSAEDNFGMSQDEAEAEVVGITEEVHPAELPSSHHSAQAELIGTDSSYAVAVPSNEQHINGVAVTEQLVEEAEVVSEERSGIYTDTQVSPETPAQMTHEAQATLLDQSELHCDNSQATPVADFASPVTAILSESNGSLCTTSNQLPATPVTVLADSPAEANPSSSRYKPDPFEATAVPVNTSHLPTDPFVDHSSGTVSRYAAADQPILPPPTPGPSTPIQVDSANTSSSQSISRGDSASSGIQTISNNIARGTNNVMEILFGSSKSGHGNFDMGSLSGSILPRTLLPSSVIFSEATKSWVATVNTSQKALEAKDVQESSKALRAFSVPSEKQAVALASAWAPPRMHPFASNPACALCACQFAVFRRACHCRNCGICICGACSIQWPSKMLPATYNIKRESMVNICKSCDWLCSNFRLALLDGDHDLATAIFSTGNINLTTPFANVKGELFYPVHCAVLGGNLKLLKWLVDEHCCPLRSIRISTKQKDTQGSYTSILTSKGRSLLGIALGNRNIDIVRYLVVEKGMLLAAEKGLSVDALVQNLDLVLRVIPEEVLGAQSLNQPSTRNSSIPGGTVDAVAAAFALDERIAAAMEEAADAADNDCIICCAREINCVATPCGHQMCCTECSTNISRCPVCTMECSFMRVFKP